MAAGRKRKSFSQANMCRFVGLMSCSGEGHSCQFISFRLEKNVNTTHTLQDARGHNMVARPSTEGFKERLWEKDALDAYGLIFFSDSRLEERAALHILLWIIRTVGGEAEVSHSAADVFDLDSSFMRFFSSAQTIINSSKQCDYLLRAVLLFDILLRKWSF